jgi:putative ABC transport system permease protein
LLSQFFHDSLSLGIAQAVVAAIMAMGMVMVARYQSIHVERETVIALLRAIVQIVLVGSVLIVLLRGPQWTSIFALLAMMVAAAATTAKRAGDIPDAFKVSLYGILIGSGAVILVMTLLGVIDPAITSVIPVGSMLVFNAMTATGLALNRFEAEIKAHAGQIEAGLALGASSHTVVAPYVQAAVKASMIPRIDSLRSLGIVWIPGLMAGMVLSGEDPIYAAVYQFVVMALVFVVAGLTSVVTTLLIRSHAFSTAEQLLLRPGRDGSNAKGGQGGKKG